MGKIDAQTERLRNPNIVLINPCDDFLEHKGDRVPLGLLQLSSYLKNKGIYTQIVDLNHDSLTLALDTVGKINAGWIGLSVSTPNYPQCINIARTIRQNYPNVGLIAGGTHISDLPSETLTVKTFDYAVVGEAEEAVHEIILGKHEEGVVYAKKIQDLNTIPYPDYDSVDTERYSMTVDGKKATTVITSKGCRFSCFYCGSANSGWRGRSAQHVVGELKMLYDKYGYRAFYVADDIFTMDFERTFKICELIRKEFPLKDISWRATTRSSLLTQEMCFAMKEAGCEVISIGLESGDDTVLKAMQKHTTVEIQERGLTYCKNAGIKVKGFFIFPLPKETKETIEKTILWAKKLVNDGLLHYADLYVLTPYPNTPFWKDPEAYDIKITYPENSDWSEYFQVGKNKEFNIKISHPNFTNEEIEHYLKTFYKEVKIPGLTYQ